MKRSIKNQLQFRRMMFLPLLVLSIGLLIGCRSTQKLELPVYGQSGLGEFAPNTLIVYYDQKVGNEDLLENAKKMGCDIAHTYQFIPAVAIRIPHRMPIDEGARIFQQVKGVTHVDRNLINRLDR